MHTYGYIKCVFIPLLVFLYLQCDVPFVATGSVSFTPTTGTWKVFVIGGYSGGYLSDTEKVDPMEDESNCIKPANYPVEISTPTVELIGEDSIISCGGYDGTNNEYSSACYEYDHKTSNWKFVAPMIEGRTYAASVVLGENKIWITGGYGDRMDYGMDLKTTEILDVETKTFQTGPDLPETMVYHCMTNLNRTHVFIGEGEYGSYNSYLVDTGKDPFVFHELPTMSKSRSGAACAVINIDIKSNNHFQNKEEEQSELNSVIVMAGGYDNDGDENGHGRRSSELFVVEDNSWIEGPLLPRGFYLGGSATINGNSMIVVGGDDENGNTCDDIIMLNPISMEFETLPGTLQTPRSYFGMTALMDNEDC